MIGWPRVHHRVTDSTNERAKQLALAGAPHGTLVTAGEQTAGRGRQGRSWLAAPGDALLMSVVVRDVAPVLPLATAVAVAETCEAAGALEARIKWPNDVWIEGRKVAGILIEGRPQEGWAVLGIGLNVATTEDEFPGELRGIATSLQAAADGDATTPPEREAVLARLLEALDARLADEPDKILASWSERDALRGQAVRWKGGAGTATGIDESGALKVQTDAGLVTLDAGEVHLLR